MLLYDLHDFMKLHDTSKSLAESFLKLYCIICNYKYTIALNKKKTYLVDFILNLKKLLTHMNLFYI